MFVGVLGVVGVSRQTDGQVIMCAWMMPLSCRPNRFGWLRGLRHHNYECMAEPAIEFELRCLHGVREVSGEFGVVCPRSDRIEIEARLKTLQQDFFHRL